MRDFNRGGGYGRGRSDRQMHTATCSECGKECQVPFRPTGEKPVYCSECFSQRGGNDNRRSGGRDNYPPRRSEPTVNYQSQFDEINQKLDAILDAVMPKAKKTTKKEPVDALLEEEL